MPAVCRVGSGQRLIARSAPADFSAAHGLDSSARFQTCAWPNMRLRREQPIMRGRVIRSKFAALLGAFLLTACQAEHSNSPYDHFELSVLGSARWTSVDVGSDRHMTISDGTPGLIAHRKSFRLSEGKFAVLKRRLGPYYQLSRSFSDTELEHIASNPCNGQTSKSSDMARVRIDWTGQNMHRYYWLDFNCDPVRDRTLITDLSNIISGFPSVGPGKRAVAEDGR